jgi:hypothetical protein
VYDNASPFASEATTAPEIAPLVGLMLPNVTPLTTGATLAVGVARMGTVTLTEAVAWPSLALTMKVAVLAPCGVAAASRAAWVGV